MTHGKPTAQEEALTLNEVAILANVSERSVHKALEEGVFTARRAGKRYLGRVTSKRVLDSRSVGYFRIMVDLRESGWSVPIESKKRIASYVLHLSTKESREDLQLAGPIVLARSRSWAAISHCVEAAARYARDRNRWIVVDEAIKGGTPVIKGSRMTVYSVLGRVDGGDSIDEIAEENPDIPREAFEAAVVFARANPMRGRPAGRPWDKAV